MPIVKKTEFRKVWEALLSKFYKETHRNTNTDKLPDRYAALAEWLSDDSPYKIRGNYLYKEVHLEKLSKGKDDHIYINSNALQCLYHKYPERKKEAYSDEFYVQAINRKQREKSIARIKFYKDEYSLSKPIFPPENPSYPATPHIPLEYKNFKKLSIKNESYNPTGTHKDRFAWEIVNYYADRYHAWMKKKESNGEPRLSIISSGSAAIAIQNLLNTFQLPALKVIYDKSRLSPELVDGMKEYGCELFPLKLNKERKMDSREVLKETKNLENGIEITFSKDLAGLKFKYYDWMALEILNQNPDYCIVPFGSGQLYQNILEMNKRQQTGSKDPRFFGDTAILKKCQFIGATCGDNNRTKMDKLLTWWNTPSSFQFGDYRKFCSRKSNYIPVTDRYIKKAIEFAETNHIVGEPSGLSSLALFFQLEAKEELNPDKKILIVNTGALKIESAKNRKNGK